MAPAALQQRAVVAPPAPRPAAALAPPPAVAPSPEPKALEVPSRDRSPSGALPAAPAILPYRDGLPIPAGYHVEHRAAGGLIGTGIATLAIGYAAGLGVATSHDFEGSLGWMAVPIIGAWPAVAGSEVKCTADDVPAAKKCLSDAYNQATTIAIVAVDGMVQATGVVLLVAGLLSGRSELVRDDLHISARQRPEGGFDLGVYGRF